MKISVLLLALLSIFVFVFLIISNSNYDQANQQRNGMPVPPSGSLSQLNTAAMIPTKVTYRYVAYLCFNFVSYKVYRVGYSSTCRIGPSML